MRLLPRSLFGQVFVAQSLIFAAVATCIPLALSHILGLVVDDYVSARLHRDAERLAASVFHDPAGWHVRSNLRMGPFFSRDFGSRAFAVVADGGRVIGESTGRFRLSIHNLPLANNESFLHSGSSDILIHPLVAGRARVWVVIGQNRHHPEVIVDDVVAEFLSRLVWIVPAAMLASLLLGAFFMRRATRGIEVVSREANAITPGRLDARLSAERLPLEAQPLARAANHALDRVEAAYRQQGEFVANVAHEMRTPLALIALKAETVETPTLRAQLLEAVDRASHVVSQLMELAFVENLDPGVEAVNLSAIAMDAVETQAPLVFRSGRSIELQDESSPVACVAGSPGLVRIALTNLIDNAVRHTPADTRIVVTVLADGAIEVADNGPGISVEDRTLARARYWRSDTRRSDSAGLGLAIVERIMTALGGTMTLAQAEGGGTRATLLFKKGDVVRLA
ncbi:MAG TPA: ATP-binding protein [Allosphingosinicella sp.]|nr:ATP-binding protein [Allosphingosinicella sp.]